MDYREFAEVTLHQDWHACQTHFDGRRLFALTTRGLQRHDAPAYRENDVFVFGPESRGLPQPLIDALPVELAYVDKGVVPVLLAQPIYKWGDVGVRTIVEKLHDKKDPPQPIIQMDLVRVTKANLGQWARQLKDWGFTDVPDAYLQLP